MRNAIYLFWGLLALAISHPILAAKQLGPPIEELQSAPDRNRIVVAEARDKPGPDRILFLVTERLSGEAPDEVLLRTDQQSFNDVSVGQSYVVAWSYQRRNRQVIGGWETDPEGPHVVSVLGLGSTALFEATPEMKYLFAPGTMTDAAAADRQIDALLAQLQYEDARSHGLVTAELWLREDLTEQMGTAQVAALRDILQTANLAPQHLDYLLRSTYRLPPGQTTPWLGEELRKIITEHGTQYDLSSFVPSLVITAAEGLRQAGSPADIDLLGTLLYSNNPGVSKAALATMDDLDPKAARAQAEQAMARGSIHSETRKALERYLRSTGT